MTIEEETATKTETKNNWFIIFIYGKFVVKYLTRIRLAFNEAENQHYCKIAIDLSNVTHIDSSAITLLANFQKRLMEKGSKLVIYGATQDVSEILSIVGLDKVITVSADKDFYEKIINKKI